MSRAPARPPRSPAAPRPERRLPSPGSACFFSEPRAPHGGCGRRGASPRGGPPFSPFSPFPPFSPASHRGLRDGSPAGFGGGGRGFGGHGGFRRPPSCSPGSGRGFQSSDSVEKYFSPAMVRDPWAALQPVARRAAKQ